MNGIIVVNKPQNFTSFDVTAIVRKKFGTKKVGHGGTLDPMATGVLPVFVGNATKAVDLVSDKSKSYRAAEMRDVQAVLPRFVGEIEQTPPMYSALKVNGQKLCDLARKGIEVERKPRKITVTRLELIEFDGRDGIIEIDCSAGTYIRTLADDIGRALGTRAVMTSLVRTKSCGFTLDNAVPIDDIKTKPTDEIPVLSVDTVLHYPSVILDSEQKRLYLNGVRLDAGRIKHIAPTAPPTGELLCIYEENSPFLLGAGRINEQGELVSVKQFAD